jgi:hypothetical protein
MDIVVPMSFSAAGQITVLPSQKARFQMVASESRPRASTNTASSKP